MYGDGRGFVPDALVEGAPVLILAQGPGADEERGQRVVGWVTGRPVYETCAPQPLIGRTGAEMERVYFPLAQLERGRNVSLANVLKCRVQDPRRTNDLPSGPTLTAALSHCTRAHLHLPVGVRLVVAMGALAWRALAGPGSITDWRGFLHPNPTLALKGLSP